MKIAVFHNLSPGGAKRVLFEEVKALSKGHELHLFEFRLDYDDFLDPKPLVNKTYRFKFDIESDLPFFFTRLEKDYKNFVKLASIHKKIAQKINKEGYNVVLAHLDIFTQAPFLLRFLKPPSLYYCEEPLRIAYEKELEFDEEVFFLKKWYEKLTRIVRKDLDKKNARLATKILTNSKYTQERIKEAYAVEAKVCYPGVDATIFKPSSNKKAKILFLGTEGRISGLDLARKAFMLAKEKVDLEFKQIKFSKEMDDGKLAGEYSSSLLTLCSSYNEPFGLKVIESMACETPVLAVNGGGYRETVVSGKTGYLIRRDPKAFAKKIIYLIKHPEVVRKMGKEGRAHVIKNFSWEEHVDCVEKVLKEIALKD